MQKNVLIKNTVNFAVLINFKEILSPSKTKNQRFCHLWGQYEVYEDIISDLTYKNFLYSETKRFFMISQIFSKIISFCVFERYIKEMLRKLLQKHKNEIIFENIWDIIKNRFVSEYKNFFICQIWNYIFIYLILTSEMTKTLIFGFGGT